MTWLAHPYRRFIFLGALLYAGMVWLGYCTTNERYTFPEQAPVTEYCPIANISSTTPKMTADTVAVVHRFRRVKGVRPLSRMIDRVVEPRVKMPKVVQRIPPPPPLPPPPTQPVNLCGGIWFSERLPVFPGCDDGMPYEEREACGKKKLLEFIYSNIRYPVHALEESCSGKAIIEFVVEKDGRVGEAVIIEDPGCGLGMIALAAVSEMNQQGIVWVPGWQHGRPISVKYLLPIRFKLK